ncbi:MAG TPA: hypothetical protein VLC92_20605 [Rhodocyclaceae bacterium]|nr:hypothetical protein [Rhodocyclaceae bacterium]
MLRLELTRPMFQFVDGANNAQTRHLATMLTRTVVKLASKAPIS